MNEESANKKIIRDFFEQGYQFHNYSRVREIVAENYSDHSPAGAKGNEEAIGILKIVEGMFSDLKLEILDMIEEKNMVASRVLYSGNHTGICMGMEPTGKRITFEALENFRIENGKIAESWGYWPDAAIESMLKEQQRK